MQKIEFYGNTVHGASIEYMDANYGRCDKCVPCHNNCMYIAYRADHDDNETDEEYNAAWCICRKKVSA